MTRDEVDAFLASPNKGLPASPVWRIESRKLERRANLPVTLNGVVTPIKLNLTIRLDNLDYLMIGLSAPPQISRLCMTTGHRDRKTKKISYDAHFHPWEANRPTGVSLPKKLEHAVPLPATIGSKDAAFSWFLDRHMISTPVWAPVGWPDPGVLL